MCTLPNDGESTSVYYSRTPDIRSTLAGVFTEDFYTGRIYYCDSQNYGATLVAQPPSGGMGAGYYGLGGWDSWNTQNGTGLVLVATSFRMQGMWFCDMTTVSSCVESAFIPFPKTYCESLRPTGTCNPYGTVLDASLNVYWVDPNNTVFTECTSASDYTSCSTLPASSALKGYEPVGLALINGTSPYLPKGWHFYVTDNSCSGNVWMGSTMSLSLVTSVGDSLEGIGSSTRDAGNTQQLFVGVTGLCSHTPPKILDISNASQIVSTPFKLQSSLIGISTCVGQCLQDKPASRMLFFSSGGTDVSADATF